MIGMEINLRETFGRWMDGLGAVFGRKGVAASHEISLKPRPAPRDGAEEALWQAMGWTEPQGEDALKVAARAAGEAIAE